MADSLDNCYVDLSAFHIHCDLVNMKHMAVASEGERFPGDYGRPMEVMEALSQAYPQTICWGTDTPAYYFISHWRDNKGETHHVDLRCGWDTEARALRTLPQSTIIQIARTNPLNLLFS